MVVPELNLNLQPILITNISGQGIAGKVLVIYFSALSFVLKTPFPK
jgi:hypothetical protein